MKVITPVKNLFMVGPNYAKRLEKLEIKTIENLLYHFPFRYLDYSLISPIARIQAGETLTIIGKIISIKNEYTKGGKKIQRAQVADNSGNLEITWFNQPFLIRTLKINQVYRFSGQINWFGRKIVMNSPEYEMVGGNQIHTGRLVPIYHETSKVSSKWLRSRIAWLLEKAKIKVKDFLPEVIKKKHHLLEINDALGKIHFPKSNQEIEEARQRFAFEELFLLQIKTLFRKKDWQNKKLASAFKIDQKKINKFIKSLPFKLTNAQQKVVKEIINDLKKEKPMNRLLEGDVGSGKTVVAAIAIYFTWLNQNQSFFMAPTEILAKQHFQTLKEFLEPFGLKIKLITGSIKNKKIDEEIDIFIGTHALLHRQIDTKRVGLIIIDEQHRFGVEQRSQLLEKGSSELISPHLLTMTATPIPRSIALTLYGDLDLSVIDELPQGRQKVKTWVVPQQKRANAYQWIKDKIKDTKEQCFLVCPLIEESETLQTAKAATVEYEKLSKKVFPDLKLGLLHGRMKAKEKDDVIGKFREGKLDILVATPVVEVGIDIPQATIMVIEAADRFGLSQLHQLRGRVGRSTKESYCLLFSEINYGKPFERIKSLERINIGIKLAELDLKLRGPGEIYGASQHGFFKLKVASFADIKMIKETRKVAEEIIDKIDKYSLLQAKLKRDKIEKIKPN